MHASKPYGLHVVGGKLSSKDEAFISNAAKKLTNLKSLSGVDSLKNVYDLPDGGSFIVQDIGGNFRVIAYKPILEVPRPIFDGVAKPYVPMLFSGVVIGSALLKEDQGLTLGLTQQTRRRLVGYSNKSIPNIVGLRRFSCRYSHQFGEFLPDNPINGLVYTQYMQQRPTWYSGAMAEVMQIVGGYGWQDLGKLPETPIEQALFEVPEKYSNAIIDSIKGFRLPGYTGMAHEKGEFQYNYKSIKTNLIAFDASNKPWLVEVSKRGVWVMPMPIVPATTTNAFYEYMQEVGDTEILAIINRFGGMPSGESFPADSSDFEAWRRAGVIIKVCDSSDFYEHMTYSSAMGWSMNNSGNEGVNTCYDFDYKAKLFYGLTYKLKLNLGAAKKNGWVSTEIGNSAQDMSYINKYLPKLYRLLTKNTPTNLAIKYKINNSDFSLIDFRARAVQNEVGKSEVDYWHNLESEPIAKHRGRVVETNRGYLFEGRNIKVPEPMLSGCVSLEVLPSNLTTPRLATDTVVLAYYVGDSLKTVKTFLDTRPQAQSIESDFEDNMFVGQWRKRELSGETYVNGDIYMTDIDDRQVLSATERLTEIVGKDLGFSQPFFNFLFYFWKFGTFWRGRYFTTHTKKTNTYNPSLRLAVCVPYFCRNAVIYAKTSTYASKMVTESLTLSQIKDPYSYEFWTYHPAFAYFGELEVMKGRPYPQEGKPVYAEIEHYQPTNESDFANEGPWLPYLPYDITSMMYGYSSVIWAKSGFPPPPKVDTYSKEDITRGVRKQEMKVSMYNQPDFVRAGDHDERYYLKSPDEMNNMFYRDGCKVVFGNTTYANISEETETGNKKQWGETTLVNNAGPHHFIGVINE